MRRIILAAVLASLPVLAAYAQRLPDNVIPESYDLSFAPDLTKATFSGEETIHVKLVRPAQAITLNSAEIAFQETTITAGGHSQQVKVTFDEAKDQATLSVPSTIPAGPAEIHIRFTGILNDQMRGFYLSKTARRRYAVTQFESTDARRAFPCFDEPAYKAVFRITLAVDNGDIAISNAKISSDIPGPAEGKHTVQFAPTPKMSSYLVAMLVGDFQCLSGSADNIPIRVCAVPEKKDMGAFALAAAENILQYYDRYYYTKYPFQKLDLIAIPDFEAGAMENTAAITYRETDLLLNEKTATKDALANVASVIAHEMAHQWFGDLVTMKWWDDLWLNEGFATWMSSKPLAAWKPEWNERLADIQGTEGALNSDAIASIRAIRAKAETPAEIDALFDEIAYDKAAAVIRMVEAYVGEEVFRKGANAYLQTHAYGNATAEDFWNAIAAASGKPVDKIMKSFIDQPGAPMIAAKTACNNDHTTLALSQHRYFGSTELFAAPSQALWQIPVSVRTADSQKVTYEILGAAEQSFELPGCPAWVLFNAGGIGYYRSDYGADYAKMSSKLESDLSSEERLRFLGDSWAMVRIGRLGADKYLESLDVLSSENSRIVAEAMLRQIHVIHDNIVASADRSAYEAWVRKFLGPMMRDLGTEPVAGEPGDRSALRSEVMAILSVFGRQPELIERARATAEAYMKDPATVDPANARSALSISALNGDAALYDQYLAHLKAAHNQGEFYAYFMGLIMFRDSALIGRTFDLLLSPQVRAQDLNYITLLFSDPDMQAPAWEVFKADFSAIRQKEGPASNGLVSIAGQFCDAALRDDSQQFFKSQNIPGSERPLHNALDRANACIELKSLQQANVAAFLKRPAQLPVGAGN
jgi:aminopeptidase N